MVQMMSNTALDIQTRTKCSRPSKRYELLVGQWQKKRFDLHRKKVAKAEPRVDFKEPVSATLKHVQVIRWAGEGLRKSCCVKHKFASPSLNRRSNKRRPSATPK